MKSCDAILESLDWCYGMPALSGMMSRLYVIPAAWLVKRPKYVLDKYGRPTSAVLTGSFETAADKKWQYIDIDPQRSHFTSEPQGEVPSQTQLNKLDALHPGVDERATIVASMLNNNNVVGIFQDMQGRARVLGSERYIPKWTHNQDGGEGNAGTTSTTIHCEVTDLTDAPFYVGEIETVDGTVTFSLPGDEAADGPAQSE